MSRFLHYEQCPRCADNGRDHRKDNLALYADGSEHCFACGYHKFPAHYVKKENETLSTENKAKLPHDFTRDVPTRGLQWLLQWGLPYSYWKPQIGYSPSEERLVFTIGTPLQFSIGRWVGDPLALPSETKPPRKWYVWGDAHKHAELIGDVASSKVVLCEDILSAHKIASAGFLAIPLFGTNIHKAVLYFLINDVRPVVLWLDKDQQLNVKKKALGLEMLLDRGVQVVITEKDPKALGVNEIIGAIDENF